MALTEEPTRSKVWSVFFRHAKFGMLMLNMGSKLVAVFVILVIGELIFSVSWLSVLLLLLYFLSRSTQVIC